MIRYYTEYTGRDPMMSIYLQALIPEKLVPGERRTPKNHPPPTTVFKRATTRDMQLRLPVVSNLLLQALVQRS